MSVPAILFTVNASSGRFAARISNVPVTCCSGLLHAVRDDCWTVIVYPPINHRQLFDLRNDPDETRDLTGDPQHAGEIERLTTLLQAWQAKVGDRQPRAVAKPRPREVSFDGYVRQPDQWQPPWICDPVERLRDPRSPECPEAGVLSATSAL